MAGNTIAERVTALEVEFKGISKKQDEITAKLDDLLALRYKGAGAFWLATSLAGIGAVSIFIQLLRWLGVSR